MGTRARKAWTLIVLLIVCVVIVAGLVVLTKARERPCPLAIQFIGFTNDATQTYGVFVVTNRSDISLRFRAITESKASGSWPTYPVGTVLPHYSLGTASPHWGPYDIAAHQSRELRASLPSDGTPVRMSIACEEPWTRWRVPDGVCQSGFTTTICRE